MKRFLLFLIIASTPFANIDLALASRESERTNAFQFASIQRYLSVNSTIDQADEERKLTKEEILTAFEQFLPQLSDFSYSSIKYFAKLYFTTMKLRGHLMDPPPDMNHFVLSSLFTEELLYELRRRNTLRFETYVDIALYLVLLEKVDGSTLEAARQIDQAIYTKSMQDIAFKMEEGQFHMWSRVLGPEQRVRLNVFECRKDTEWRNAILKRYRDFLANEEKRRIPGLIGASTSRF